MHHEIFHQHHRAKAALPDVADNTVAFPQHHTGPQSRYIQPRLARRSVAGALALGSWTAYAGLWQQTEREKSRSWLRRHGNGVPVRLGTGLRVLAVDLDPHTFNHFWCFAICLLVVVNEIAALSDPGA